METEEALNPLLSKSKNSDSRLQVQLHPLVILNVSDHITRHILRQKTGPIVGAILGSQNGRDITMEHAFECKVDQGSSPEEVLIDAGWFHDRLQQFKDVHKAPALDFVGWFTLAPPSGPEPQHLPIHHQLLHAYNESALLLTFHPSSVADGTSKGGKLPLAIYETVYEAASGDDDKHMQSSGEAGPQLSLRFQELPYTIETGEAEMIGVDFVASGAANASVSTEAPAPKAETQTAKSKGKGKGKAIPGDGDTQTQASDLASLANKPLSSEDEEIIASLTAKANAIKMLQQRISLISSYLASLPPCYLNTPPPANSSTPSRTADPRISYPILRQISSMLARLPLLTLTPATAPTTNGSAQPSPSDPRPPTATPLLSPHKLEQQTQQTDTHLVTLLSSLGSTLQSATSLGRKFAAYETSRNVNMSQSQRRMMDQAAASQMPFGFDQGPGGFDDARRRMTPGPSYSSSAGRAGNGGPGGGGGGDFAFESQSSRGGGGDVDFYDDEGVGDDEDGDEMLQQEEWEEMDENT